MKISFTKMEGCGNDYIYIEDFSNQFKNPSKIAKELSNRHFGIGGDGVIFIRNSSVADACMVMFNEDGSEGKMCGNGIRCVAKYLHDHHIVDSHTMTIDTLSGLKKIDLVVVGDEVVGAAVDMGKAEMDPKLIPAKLEGKQVVDRPVSFNNEILNITCVSMGNPHCVIFVENTEEVDIEHFGPMIENSPIFPERTNVEFVQIIDEKHLKMRVWERGAGETLACGTGACASVVAAAENGFCSKRDPVQVSLKGGDLLIRYSEDSVLMQGPARMVYSGTVEIESE